MLCYFARKCCLKTLTRLKQNYWPYSHERRIIRLRRVIRWIIRVRQIIRLNLTKQGKEGREKDVEMQHCGTSLN